MSAPQGDQPPNPPPQFLDVVANLARTHREHEKFYSQAPLRQAAEVQAASRALKALAAQWGEATVSEHPLPNPYAGAEDLNAPGLVAESGILFMEGEGEPVEIARLNGTWVPSPAIAKQPDRGSRRRWNTPGRRRG